MNQLQLANIARNSDFQLRVNLLTVKAALAQLAPAEVPPTPGSVLLAQRILKGEEPVERWAMSCVTNPSIAAGAHAEDGSTIADADLEFTVNSFWNAFAV